MTVATPTPAAPPAARPPAPGRAGTATEDVFDAVLDLLVEVGYEALTMDAVAHRAHVSKATIYKRWDGKPLLVARALSRHGSCAVAPFAAVHASSLRADLVAFAQLLNAGDDRTGPLLAALAHAVQRSPELAATVRAEVAGPCETALRDILDRARARGETTARAEDLGPAADVLPAMVVVPLVFGGRRLDDDELVALIDRVVLPVIAAAGAPVPDTDDRTAR